MLEDTDDTLVTVNAVFVAGTWGGLSLLYSNFILRLILRYPHAY
jgi:hypothetical protein